MRTCSSGHINFDKLAFLLTTGASRGQTEAKQHVVMEIKSKGINRWNQDKHHITDHAE